MAIGIAAILFSGCAEAKPPEGQPKEISQSLFQEKPEPLPLHQGKGSIMALGEASEANSAVPAAQKASDLNSPLGGKPPAQQNPLLPSVGETGKRSLPAEGDGSVQNLEGPVPPGPIRDAVEGVPPTSKGAGPLAEQTQHLNQKPSGKIFVKPLKDFLPAEKPRSLGEGASPNAKAPGSEEKPKPIYGLPLEYHFDLPEVPERIRGPTPMPVVSKPGLPGPLPKRE